MLERNHTSSHGAQASAKMARVCSHSAPNRQILSFRRSILAPQGLKVATPPGWKGQGELTYLVASSKNLKLHHKGLRLVIACMRDQQERPRLPKTFLQSADPSSVKAISVNGSDLKGARLKHPDSGCSLGACLSLDKHAIHLKLDPRI